MRLLRLMLAVDLIRLILAVVRLARRRLTGCAGSSRRAALALARCLQGNPPDPAGTSRP